MVSGSTGAASPTASRPPGLSSLASCGRCCISWQRQAAARLATMQKRISQGRAVSGLSVQRHRAASLQRKGAFHDPDHATGQSAASGRPQVIVGLALSHEQFAVPQLVEFGVLAEQAGFAAVWASEHFAPWQDNQGHAAVVATLLPLSALQPAARRRQRTRQRHGTCRNTAASGARTCPQGKRKEHVRYEYLHQQLGRSKRFL